MKYVSCTEKFCASYRSYDTPDLISTIFLICRQGAAATIVSGHQAKDLTIRNGLIGNVNIHFDKNDDAKSTH